MTRSVSQPGIEQIPAHIAQRLRQLVRRAKRVALARGMAWTIGTFLGGVLAAVGVGVLIKLFRPELFTLGVRAGLGGLVALATLLVAVLTLIRPLRRPLSLTAAAMALEKDHPELQERISTTVELLLSDDPAPWRGSQQMIHAVAVAADQDSTHVSPRQAIRAGRAGWVWLIAALLAAAGGALAVKGPDNFRQLWDDRVVWTTVESVSGDMTVVQAEPATLEARSTARLRSVTSATLVIEYLDGTPAEAWPVRAARTDGNTAVFRYTVNQAARPFRYYFRVHDGRSPIGQVTVLERPQVGAVRITCHYPPYTGLNEPVVLHDDQGKLTALRRSRLELLLDVNCELDPASSFLVFEPASPQITQISQINSKNDSAKSAEYSGNPSAQVSIPLQQVGPKQYRAWLDVADRGRCHFQLYGAGLQSRPNEWSRQIEVDEDTPPTVQIEKPTPRESITMRPDDHLPIAYEAQDDFGLSGLRIRYRFSSERAWSSVPATMPADTVRRARSTVTFDLKPLNLDRGLGTIEYCLEALDNRPPEYGGAQAGRSETRTINLEMSAKDYAVQRVEMLRADFADAVAQIVAELKAAQADVRSVQKGMVAEPAMDAAQEASTGSAVKHLSAANDQAMAAALNVDSTDYQKMGERLKDIALAHIQPARQFAADTLDLGDDAGPRKDKLTEADVHIQRALDLLLAVGREFGDLIKMEEGAKELARMSKEQEDIADDLTEFRDPADLAKLTKEELDLLAKARELLGENKEQAAKPLFDIAQKAEKTLNEKIRELAAAQKDLADQTQKAQDLQDLDKRAQDLARRQGELAKQADRFGAANAEPLAKADAPKGLDKPMADAARALDKTDLPAAIDRQHAATTQIDRAEQQTRKAAQAEAAATQADGPKLADARRQSTLAKQLADKARQLEQQQNDLLKQTDAAKAAQADLAKPSANQPASRPDQTQAQASPQPPTTQQAADKSAQDQARKDQAKRQVAEQLADLGKKQQALAAEAAALENRMKAAQAAEPMRKLADEHNAAKPAAEAAADLKVPTDPAAAAKPQREAARQLDQLAQGLDDLARNADERVAQEEQARKHAQAEKQANAQAANIKQKQEQLNEETRKLADDMAKAKDDLNRQQLADLTAKQKDVAERAANLADAVAKQPPDQNGEDQPAKPNPAADLAAANAKAAADDLERSKLPEAGEKGQQAEAKMADLAGQLAKQAGQEAGVDAKAQQAKANQAAEAGKLAEAQQQINDQLANLGRKDPQANLPLRQEALRDQTKELGEQARMVADFMKQLAPQIGATAKEAADQLAEKAPAAQAQAAEAMRSKQLPAAKAAEQQAIAAAEKADQMFQEAAKQAAAAAEDGPPGDKSADKPDQPETGDDAGKKDEPDPYDPLAQAAWAQQQAEAAMKDAAAAAASRQSLEAQLEQAKAAVAAREAAGQLGQAAKAMAAATVSMSAEPGSQASQPGVSFSPPWFSTMGTGPKAPDLRKLNFELGITTTEWNRLPGYLQQAIIQSSDEKIPQEYRELVKRYFQTISQDANTPDGR